MVLKALGTTLLDKIIPLTVEPQRMVNYSSSLDEDGTTSITCILKQ